MAGIISSIGIGSGLQLQDILDQLRDVDNKAIITPKQNQIADYQAQLNEFTEVENKLYAMKSAALELSLSSTFLGRTVSSSNENVLSATAVDGTAASSTTLVVDGLAQRSSWMSSNGASSKDAIVYVPTSVESTTGVVDPDDPLEPVVTKDGTLDITFGGSTSISVNVGPSSGVTTLNQLVDAIDAAGAGFIDASTYEENGRYYLRVETADAGGTGEANRVKITHNDTDLTLSAPQQTFQYSVGGAISTISISPETTLSALVDQINEDTHNPGVSASIIDDGGADPFRLVLKSNEPGEDNRISILSQLPDLNLSEQAGYGGSSLNARFSIDGIPYQRSENTFSDVVSGVTITLQGTGTSTVEVVNHDDAVKETIKSLVTAYNDVVQEIEKNTAYDQETEKFGVLSKTTLRDLPYGLQKIMTSTVAAHSNGKIKTMFDLGLEFERDGTITVNEDVLSQALSDDADGVQAFFLGDADKGVTGLADQLNERLRILLAGDGQVKAERQAAQTRIDDLNTQIEQQTDRLNKKYDLMTRQFIELDSYMNQMTSISNYLASQFQSLASSGSSSGSSNK